MKFLKIQGTNKKAGKRKQKGQTEKAKRRKNTVNLNSKISVVDLSTNIFYPTLSKWNKKILINYMLSIQNSLQILQQKSF